MAESVIANITEIAGWMVSGFSAVSNAGLEQAFLVPVPSRDSKTLLSVMKIWIWPGTTTSDCWWVHDCLSYEGFLHQTVNHSVNFVDPDSGTHTQNIEHLWLDVPGGIPRFGSSNKHLVGYLAEFIFKTKFSDNPDRIHAFFPPPPNYMHHHAP